MPRSITNNSSVEVTSTDVTQITGSLVGDVVGPLSNTKLSAEVIENINISNTANILDTKLATIISPGKIENSATSATSTNIPNSIVLRNASGGFEADHIITSSITATENISATNTTISDTIYASNAVISDSISTLQVTADGNISATSATINGNINSTNAIISESITSTNAIINEHLTAANATFNGNINGTNAIMSGNITSTGATINGNITASSASINGSLTSGNISSVNATINGPLSSGNATVNGSTTITGNATINGNLTVLGSINTTTITLSNISTTPMLLTSALHSAAIIDVIVFYLKMMLIHGNLVALAWHGLAPLHQLLLIHQYLTLVETYPQVHSFLKR